MSKRIAIVLERPKAGLAEDTWSGMALGRAVEAHPALQPLLDFAGPDPAQVAAQLGVTYAYDPDDVADLAEIDFGPSEWHEPSAGLAVVKAAVAAVRADPGSVAAAVYDPGLHSSDVLADLEAAEHVLLQALEQETRFRLTLTD